jgi:type VI secretion system VasD/TssJ family lipoprotein
MPERNPNPHKCSPPRLAALCLLTFAGCGAATPRVQAPCDAPSAVTVHVHPSSHLNPDRAGLPRSVVLRFYQLQDERGFHTSSFSQLWRASGSETGDGSAQVVVLPGHSAAHTLQRAPEARYLGVVANFRERRGERSWRAVSRLPSARCGAAQSTPVELELVDFSLQLSSARGVR